MKQYYQMGSDETRMDINGSLESLSSEKARENQKKYGPNELQEEKKKSVGMIFLDHRFTIPNFPSRLLSYMQAKIPVLACTDPNTDIGKVITEGGFGWWCESNSIQEFTKIVDCICSADLKTLGDNAYRVLNEKFSVSESYNTIVNHF